MTATLEYSWQLQGGRRRANASPFRQVRWPRPSEYGSADSWHHTRGPALRAVSWLRNEAERARLNRELGRDGEAERIEEQLLQLLSVADADHQLLRDLKEQQARQTSSD